MTALATPAVAQLGALYAAQRSGVPNEPLTDIHPSMSMMDAYQVQADLVTQLLADGDPIVGCELGISSSPIQRISGVDCPDFAHVLASHVYPDTAELDCRWTCLAEEDPCPWCR